MLSGGTEERDRVTCMALRSENKETAFNGDGENVIAGGIAECSVCLRILNSVESLV